MPSICYTSHFKFLNIGQFNIIFNDLYTCLLFLDVPIFSHRHVLEFIVGTLTSIAMDNTLKRINLYEMYSRLLHNFKTPAKLSKS